MANSESCGAVDGEEPTEADSILIRLWGVLVDYKPKGQRRWSKALVRHGAEARSAIAAVLGMSAEQIGVRDNAG
jgi:hypothetical protein